MAESKPLSKTVLVLCFLLLLTSVWALGQDLTNPLNIGLPPNGVFSGSDFDSVQLNNGNLHAEIPLWSDKGRGLSVGFKLIFDNKGWYFTEHCDKYGYCTDTTRPEPGSNMSWTVAGPLNYLFKETSVSQQCAPGVNDLAYSYTMQEPNGTKHSFQPSPEGQCTSWAPLGSALYADDGSGWRLFLNSSWSVSYAVSQSGTIVNPFSSVVVQDANGNQLVESSPTFTDTLGRTLSVLGQTYQDSSGNSQTIQLTYQSVPIQTNQCGFSGADACYEYTIAGNKVHQVTLPGNNLTYTINYPTTASYGDPISITLPTGGQISYTWTNAQGGENVATRTETVGGQSYQWTYGAGMSITDPANNVTVPTCTVLDNTESINSPVCYITKMQYYQGAATQANLLKTVATDYAQASGHSTFYMPIRETTTWNQQSLVTKTETDWDTVSTVFNQVTMPIYVRNPKERREFAYGTNSAGGLARRTDYTYLHNTSSAYNNLNILNRATSKIVYDGSNNIKAQTTYTYDSGSITSTSSTPAPNHDYVNFGSGYTTRGNLTQTSQGLLVGSTWTWLNTTHTYDDLGNLLTTKDPNLNQTGFSYADNWGTDTNCTLGTNTFAYLTQTTDALSHQTRHSYFRCTGLVSSTKDQNDINNSGPGTTFTYDLLDRPLTVSYPDGGQTTRSYVDTIPVSVTQQKLMSAGVTIQTTSVFDGLGRLQQTQLKDPDCTSGTALVKVDHAYGYSAGAGEFIQVSTPYCNTPNSNFGLMATTQHDALDRVTSVTQTDGSTLTTAYSGTTAGLTTTVTDEGGNARESQTDALGRLTAVWEDPVTLKYETDYAYDTLDNLTGVTQQGGAVSGSWRNRSFTYDSLSRLKCAANPEVTSSVNAPASCPATDTGAYTAGTIGYTYDNNGNVLTKVAPAPNQTGTASVTTSYTYDALNRLTYKSYSDSGVTPNVAFGHDESNVWGTAVANGIGRLTHTSMTFGGASIFSYDAMGRVVNDWQCTPYNCGTGSFDISYAYDLAGDMTRYTTVGINFGQTFDAAGRVSVLTSSLTGTGFPGTIATVDSSVGYWPTRAIRKISLGNGLTETAAYNTRLQPCQSDVNSSGSYFTSCTDAVPSGNVQDFSYGFNAGSADNGNLATFVATGTASTQTFSRGYTYDALNRLQKMTGTSGVCTGLTWIYDAWGNRSSQTNNGGTCSSFSAVPNVKNQFNSYTYDAAGNLTNDGFHSYTYDAENRITQVDSGSTASYQYDAWGKRIRKTASAIGNLDYIYDTSDRVLAEYQVSSGFTGFYRYYLYMGGKLTAEYHDNTTYFRHEDHLASGRVVTTMTQGIHDSSEYQPYAEQSSGATGTTHKFTGKERDSESAPPGNPLNGLDYFGARYYSSLMGRFMTSDWAAKATAVPYASFLDPQTLNLYGYVRNNPLARTDPDGHVAGVDDATLILLGGTILFTAAVIQYYDHNPGANPGEALGAAAHATGQAIAGFFHSDNSNKNAPPPPPTNPHSQSQSTPADPNQSDKKGAQDKKLSSTEVKNLESNTNQDAHAIKEDALGTDKGLSKFDLYKNSDGDIVVKPKGSSGEGEPTGYTTEDLKPQEDK
jgi:RHS repeat-associated protein